MLRGPPPPKLQGRIDQPYGHGERGHDLQHDLKHSVVHDCATLSSELPILPTSSPDRPGEAKRTDAPACRDCCGERQRAEGRSEEGVKNGGAPAGLRFEWSVHGKQ